MTAIRFNLRAYRKKMNLTQGDLAKKLGQDQSMVSYYERHWRSVKNSTIIQIARTLDIDPLELFMDDNGVSAKDLGYQVAFFPDDHVLED